MKKIYLSPEISQMLGETEEMIATSNPDGFKGGLDNNDKITTPDDMLSRRNNVWDDDEE
ncbi:MAG: hypothetical protein IKP33_06795 [Prevotella sp.]|nr:hypothetical protein [Prevotella sp.]MBR6188227.1 hypothetical protein [Prevotella sp.]